MFWIISPKGIQISLIFSSANSSGNFKIFKAFLSLKPLDECAFDCVLYEIIAYEIIYETIWDYMRYMSLKPWLRIWDWLRNARLIGYFVEVNINSENMVNWSLFSAIKEGTIDAVRGV